MKPVTMFAIAATSVSSAAAWFFTQKSRRIKAQKDFDEQSRAMLRPLLAELDIPESPFLEGCIAAMVARSTQAILEKRGIKSLSRTTSALRLAGLKLQARLVAPLIYNLKLHPGPTLDMLMRLALKEDQYGRSDMTEYFTARARRYILAEKQKGPPSLARLAIALAAFERQNEECSPLMQLHLQTMSEVPGAMESAQELGLPDPACPIEPRAL